MKTQNKLMTVARFVAAGLSVLAPTVQASESVVSENVRTVNPNKDAVVKEEKKGQGIEHNLTTGGLDMNFARMYRDPNPIYIPDFHPKMTYIKQNKLAKQRRK